MVSGRQHPATQPTIATVAAVAKVSPASVSRVINGSPTVAPQIRVAVEQAIEQLGYVPNRAARALVTRRSDSIALVVRESVEFGISDPHLMRTLVAASLGLSGTGFQLVLMMASNDAEHAQLATYVRSGHVDGVLLVSVHADDPLPRQLQRAGIPTVFGGRPHTVLDGISYVDVDNPGGGRQAGERVVASGRTHPAIITGPPDMTAAVDRLTGFRAGLAESGGRLTALAVGDFTQASGERAMTEIMEQNPEVDAVFAASDLMALGAMRALRAAGRSIPDDVAVIGFDDIDQAQHAEPPLTTFSQPVTEQVTTMTRMLIDQIGGAPAPGPKILPASLIVRDSA